MLSPALSAARSHSISTLLSLSLALAVACLAFWFRAPPAPNRVEIDIPHPRQAAIQFQRDQQALDSAALGRIQRWMEDAWDDDLAESCDAHLGNAIQLSNEFPSLLSPWRVIWHCNDFNEQRTETLRAWVVALLEHSERYGYSAARYPELAIEVHNLTDALAFVSMQGWTLMDAQYESILDQQQLRILSLVWHPEAQSEYLVYFNPTTTQRAQRKNLSNNVQCRQHLAACILEHVHTTRYSSATQYAQALIQFSEAPVAAVQALYDQHESSILTSLKIIEWMLDDPDLISNRDEILPGIVDAAIQQDSAQAKLLKALLIEQQLMDAGEDSAEALMSAAQSELNPAEFTWRKAYFEERLDPGNKTRYEDSLAQAIDAESAHAMRHWAQQQEDELGQLEWLVRAAHHDDRHAMIQLVTHFEQQTAAHTTSATNNTVPDAQQKARYWRNKAAKLGDAASIDYRLKHTKLAHEQQTLLRLGLSVGSAEGLFQNSQQQLNKQQPLSAEQQQLLLYQLDAAAQQGHIDAMILRIQADKRLGGSISDQALALEPIKQAAAAQHPEAQFIWAQALEQGQGVTNNQARAILQYHAAAEAHYLPAQLRLAQIWQHGEGVSPNIKKAAHWYLKAAQQQGDSPKAAHTWYQLAQLHDQHQPEEQSTELAFNYYQQAATRGFTAAWQDIARYYDQGRADIEANATQALEALAQANTLDEPSLQRQQRLLETGFNQYEFNLQQIQQLSTEFEPIPEHGEYGEQALSQQLAVIDKILALSQPLQQHTDIAQAYEKWRATAADLGHAEHSLARALKSSSDGSVLNAESCADFNKANTNHTVVRLAQQLCPLALNDNTQTGAYVQLYKQLSPELDSDELNVFSRLLEAQVMAPTPASAYPADLLKLSVLSVQTQLARYHEEQQQFNALAAFDLAYALDVAGQLETRPKMIRLYQIAAKAGDVRAQHNLGRFYIRTNTKLGDNEKGLEWLELAILQGSVDALYTMGEAYQHGWLGRIDWPQALSYYRQVREQDPQHAGALSHMWTLLRDGGRGITPNPEKAEAYHQEAMALYNDNEPSLYERATKLIGSAADKEVIQWQQYCQSQVTLQQCLQKVAGDLKEKA
ncbi:MAG: hypothetical protein MI750_16860 [Xanthomonadales bacterium]|nr:hypothetical protein [Xanthomonadales bacterium]